MGKGRAKKPSSSQGGPNLNLKSVLRHEHLKNIALWSPIPSLASLFGKRLAADGEASGIASDPDLVSCQRCETILQPGLNCNIRIEKVSVKKYNTCLPQNNVVYYCSFCSHRNVKRGTSKGHMKEIYPSKKPKTPKMKKEMMPKETQSDMFSSPATSVKDEMEIGVVNTPKPILTLERDKRIRKPKNKKPIKPPESVSDKTVGGSNQSKRKSWTSMTSMKETSKKSSRALNIKIPFLL